jgi:hypothetical protein
MLPSGWIRIALNVDPHTPIIGSELAVVPARSAGWPQVALYFNSVNLQELRWDGSVFGNVTSK